MKITQKKQYQRKQKFLLNGVGKKVCKERKNQMKKMQGLKLCKIQSSLK